uniref:Cytochrome c biogenesis protein CcsA n=1 Tax=Oogamochlamys gigantea TaxID=158507 RepID=A0A0S2LMW7_9CHLO|nr:heme attachment to plastid cytochrome c [Oogamochlamys gigantea]ALO62769.1 heme attachment to plastid cytochrome c [Oogamochlamys gigantea]
MIIYNQIVNNFLMGFVFEPKSAIFHTTETPLTFWYFIHSSVQDVDFENFFRNLSFVFLFFAMLYYWTQTAFDFLTKNKLGNFLIIIANLSLATLLILRWKNSGHFPLSNLYESLMFLSWSCTMVHVIMSYPITNKKFFHQKIQENLENIQMHLFFSNEKTDVQNKILGCITSPVALFMNAYAAFSLPQDMQQAAPLVPALQSNWLMMHVTVMILSYAALILGSLLSMAFLILTFSFKISKKKNAVMLGYEGNVPSVPSFDDISFSTEEGKEKQIHEFLCASKGTCPQQLSYGPTREYKKEYLSNLSKQDFRIKIVENLDNYSYRIIGIGFSFLTIGILSGAVWANEAWGSYWSWDPKETWAFLTWLVYAIYLHTRLTKGWQGKKPAIIASVGFITVWICFLGVNLIGKGLHSYGFITS